jgi:hypothetical protein
MTGQSLVLLGDSILDNAPYTGPEPDTTAHLRRLLGGWSVERLARDGARMTDLSAQLRQMRTRPSVAVLSIGGNDITGHVGILTRRISNAADVFAELLGIAETFAGDYEKSVRAVAERAERTLLCTIYEAPLEPPVLARLARLPLAVINDRILRTGASLGLDILELRTVCTDPADFVAQIEPSSRGAAKIARAIADTVLGRPDLATGRVFARTSQ